MATRSTTGTLEQNQSGNILLQPFAATVSGEAAVLEELGVNCTGDIPSGLCKRAASVLPLLIRVEKEAIGQTLERLHQEAEAAVSVEHIKHTSEMLKQIDAEMIKNNSSSEGNIVWLTWSRCNDPHWLEKPPDVLPKPRLWREIIQQSNDEACPTRATSNTSASSNQVQSPASSEKNDARKKTPIFHTRGI